MSGTLRYEWIRISTVRSTWILLALGVLVPFAFAVFVSWITASALAEMGPRGEGGGGLGGSALLAFVPISAAILCTIGAASFGQEYRHGLIRITLSQFPRRSAVFLAKALMVAAVIVVAAVGVLAAIVLGQAVGGVLGGSGLVWDDAVAGSMGLRALLYILIYVLIAFGITALTRNQPLGIVLPIVLATIAEPIVSVIAQVQEWTWMDWVLPFSGGLNAIGMEGAEAWGHLAAFAAWAVVLSAIAWILFERRDA